tara:strand:- start:362 stop:751 length:390 start_codon:yes stop_codon:yes gene_type:complete
MGGYYDDCPPSMLMKAFMIHRSDRAIRHERRDRENADLLKEELARLAVSRDPDTIKWAAKVAKREKKRSKKEKRHLTCNEIELEIDRILGNGAGMKECSDFAFANSKKGRLPVPIQLKLKSAFPPSGMS